MKNFNYALGIFNSHYVTQRNKANDDKKIAGIDKKYLHTMEVIKDGTDTVKSLNFNDSFVELSRLTFLNHDIGRFEQMILMGNYIDSELMNSYGINHGSLGKQILANGLIKKEIPSTRAFDRPILEIVEKHVDYHCDLKDLLVLSSDLLKNADVLDFFDKASEEEKESVINTINQILQDIDRLDIYHQILEGRWIPIKTDQPIDKEVLDMFYKGQYLDMHQLKKQGLWNANVGELVRLSFINQIRLLSVAKLIYDENILMQMKQLRQNPYVDEAFDFMQNKLENMINNSNGITLTKKL